MSNFGQIPTRLICRFSELTKTEIIVVSFLYASRNRNTGQCNPGRKRITEMTGINKSHVSPAIKSLESKGWICQTADGHFLLLDSEEKVTDSVTENGPKSYEIGNKKVTESVTTELRNREPEVTDFVTKVTESVTRHNIYSSEHKKNTEGTEKRESGPLASEFGSPQNIPTDKRFFHPAIKAVRDLTKHNPKKIIWDDLIDALGVDFDVGKLERCYRAWVLKGFRESNFGWITDWYANGIPQREQNGKAKFGNGANKQSDREIIEQGLDDIRAKHAKLRTGNGSPPAD